MIMAVLYFANCTVQYDNFRKNLHKTISSLSVKYMNENFVIMKR